MVLHWTIMEQLAGPIYAGRGGIFLNGSGRGRGKPLPEWVEGCRVDGCRKVLLSKPPQP